MKKLLLFHRSVTIVRVAKSLKTKISELQNLAKFLRRQIFILSQDKKHRSLWGMEIWSDEVFLLLVSY